MTLRRLLRRLLRLLLCAALPLAALPLAAGCKPPAPSVEQVAQVRFRPAPTPPNELAADLVRRVPGATWDLGLARAAGLLLAAARDPGSRVSPSASAAALSAAGYPGPASFAREYNAGGLPEDLIAQMAALALRQSAPVDVALTRRVFGDGTALWIGAFAPRPASLDPLPRAVPMDEMVPVRVDHELEEGATMTLFVAPPFGPVRALPLTEGLPRWVDGFSVPGEYRMEVVASWPQGRGTNPAQVLLIWSLFVDVEPQPPEHLPRAAPPAPDPIAAVEALYERLGELRAEAGLRPVTRFEPFEPLAREHAAWMASAGEVAHVLPGLTDGVASRAARTHHPTAVHLEDVAAAESWQDALDLVWLSPGHRRTLLCEACTHASVGAAIEPVIQRVPRLFVVWELLSFPNGEPRSVDRRLR